uniref:Uncharacterized protein n=1 Tax=Anopheles arabiensis TaxID=7173 RepID=A0A182HR81_ANOAR
MNRTVPQPTEISESNSVRASTVKRFRTSAIFGKLSSKRMPSVS